MMRTKQAGRVITERTITAATVTDITIKTIRENKPSTKREEI